LIALATILALLSGAAVGFSLGLIGGGGSILAVPLLLYVVGVAEPHIAIGTSAFAVAVNAFVNLISHWRAGTVKWRCAILFAAAGALGAAIGSSLGKLMDGERLIFLFALVMIGAGIAMLRSRRPEGKADVQLTMPVAVKLAGGGIAAGTLSGFFGIGGGFLIVPCIMLGSGMPLLNAIGSSLFAVGVFGVTTAANYALSGFVDWRVAGEFIIGGAIGGFFGMKLAIRLASQRRALTYVFVAIVFTVAVYMLARSAASLFA
jgi:uncharacterized membrane protein YfcA